MAMPRCAGGTSFITMPPISSVPPEIFSNPAIIRSKVDFPQPDGPTKTISSPCAISRLIPLSTFTSP